MSGGSLNYFFCKCEIGTGDLWAIENAMEYLEGLGKEDSKVYMHLCELRELIALLPKKQERLSGILHDIEWTISGDWGVEKLLESIERYEEE